jgi:hypothetical protein
MTNATYTQVTSTTIDALKSTAQSENKLAKAGEIVREFFKTPEAFMAVRKQFEADAVIPALETKHRASLAFEIKRGDKSEQAEIMRKAKTTARGFVASYFSKIKAHAFPTAKPEAEELSEEQKQNAENMAFVKNAIALARKGQKLENPPEGWNMVKIMGFMNSILKEMSVTSETDTTEM